MTVTEPKPIAASRVAHPGAPAWALRDRNAYLIGIGGCGMSGLARMLSARGASVGGSDMTRTEVTDLLRADGITVGLNQSDALPDDVDLVIATAAVPPDHPQLLDAQNRGIETLSYAEALGRCMLGHTGVAIAGTHGKSTTVAMLGAALVDAGIDPNVIVGATCAQLAGGSLAGPGKPTGFRLGGQTIASGQHAGEPGVLLAEACEYNRSFHHLRPRIGAIGPIEADHLDIYGSLDAVLEAFQGFAKLLPDASEGGRLLIAHEGANRRTVAAGCRAKIETIGFSPEADWSIRIDPDTRSVALLNQRRELCSWTMSMPGVHNAINSAVAAALAITVGADPSTIADSLGAFRGLDRRMQLLGEKPVRGGVVRVWDDYGHHPTEIDSTLRALREFDRPAERGGRLICVFQPHQHSRTRFLLEEFANAFEHADAVIVPHIYFVRDSEAEKQRISAGDLVDRLRDRGVRAMHLYPFDAIVEHLGELCRAGDTLVAMGAGPVWKVARGYLEGVNA
ncbi:MAG: Mur ligase domain-containing protein [Planctomycetota bacterium]